MIYGKFEHLKILIHLTIFHIGYCQIAKFQRRVLSVTLLALF